MKSLIAHAGCSNNKIKENIKDISDIAQMGKEEDNAVDAVEKVVNLLENDERYNAGIGSKLQMDGSPRPESGIMRDNLEFGCISGLDSIKNPVSVARKVMEESNNNFIAGPQATQFALMMGFEKEDLYTEDRINEWMDIRRELDSRKYINRTKEINNIGSGTVGCVALDDDGRLCSATSTGGRKYQVEGRVGDTPIIGCGFYCNNEVAVSTTGHGESIMKSQLSMRISENYSGDLNKAIQKSLDYLERKTEGFAGAIAVDSNGDTVVNYNGEDMIFSIV